MLFFVAVLAVGAVFGLAGCARTIETMRPSIAPDGLRAGYAQSAAGLRRLRQPAA